MALTKYRPTNGGLFPRTFSSLLDDFFNETLSSASKVSEFVPHTDIAETDGNYEVLISVPGMTRENISVDVHDGLLTVSGERKFEEEKKKKTFHSIESRYGAFHRSFRLPDNVDRNRIEAEYKNGILTVIIPKDEQKTTKKTIEIKE